MKTLTNNLIGLCVIVAIVACGKPGRHVTIKHGDSYGETKIEYLGRADFNQEGTAITYISTDGYVKYSKNGQDLLAERDHDGHIVYQINNGERKQQLSTSEKMFLADAVKDMIKNGHNDD